MGDSRGKAELPQKLATNPFMFHDPETIHLRRIGCDQVTDIVKQCGENDFLVRGRSSGKPCRLKGMFQLRDRLTDIILVGTRLKDGDHFANDLSDLGHSDSPILM